MFYLGELHRTAFVSIEHIEVCNDLLLAKRFICLCRIERAEGHLELLECKSLISYVATFAPIVSMLEMHPQDAQHEQVKKKLFEAFQTHNSVGFVVSPLNDFRCKIVCDCEYSLILHNYFP